MFSLKFILSNIQDFISNVISKAIHSRHFDVYHFALLTCSIIFGSQYLVKEQYSTDAMKFPLIVGVLIGGIYLLKKEYINFIAAVTSFIGLVSISFLHPFFAGEMFTKIAMATFLVSLLPLAIITYQLQNKHNQLEDEKMKQIYEEDLNKMQVINLCEGRIKNLESLRSIDLSKPFSDNFKLSHGVSIVMVGKYFYVVLSFSGWDIIILTRHKTLENAKNDKEIVHKFADNFLDRPKEFGKGLTQFLSMRCDYFKLDDDTVKTLKEITWFSLVEMAQKNQKSFRADNETMAAMSAVDQSNRTDMKILKQTILMYEFLVVIPSIHSLNDLSKIPGTLKDRPNIPYKFRGGAMPFKDKYYCYISVFGSEIVVLNTFTSKSMAKHYLDNIAKELGPNFIDSPTAFAKKVVHEGVKNHDNLPELTEDLKESITSFYKNSLIEELNLGGADFSGRMAN